MLGSVGVGAGEDVHPVSQVGEARPDLAAVDDIVVAILDGAGLQAGEVRPRLGLAESLAPEGVAFGYAGQVLFFLLLGPVDDDGRAYEVDALVLDLLGATVADHLLEDKLHHRRGGLTAVLLGPGHGPPALVAELAAHLHLLPADGIDVGLRVVPAFGHLVFQEAGELFLKGLFLGGECEIHDGSFLG